MTVSTKWLLLPLLMTLLVVARGAEAQAPLSPDERAVTEAAIRAALEAEQAAFESKDCEATVALFADWQPLFVVSGRMIPTRSALRVACVMMTANRPPVTRELEGHVINLLSRHSAYTVSIYRVAAPTSDRGTGSVMQIVTKVWVNEDGDWRIAHLHESLGR